MHQHRLAAVVLSVGAALGIGVAGAGTAQAVIGGGPATENYPFMASLGMPDEPRYQCGAALVDQNWLLTAAHCVSDQECAAESDGSVEICTGTPRRQSIGKGDSGGPQLARDSAGRWELVGVASRHQGAGASSADKPCVYTDAGPFRSWIEQEVRH